VLQQGVENALSGNAKDVGDHVADLDVGLFQQFLNTVSFAVGGGQQPLAATSQIAQFHNLCARNETAPHIPDPQAFG
jgi:hypothetical protein